ncbi:hypothetical protein [Streptomyces anulatus]|uniref:hypothetical protein n=1 Tax=Streptomyces anulatus TaxID=1892 RepID=UPI003423B5D7
MAVGVAFGVAVGLLPIGALPARAADPPTRQATAAADGSAGAVTEEKALAEARRTGHHVEVLALRGESSEVFATPEGAAG